MNNPSSTAWKMPSGGVRNNPCHLLYMFVAAASRGSCHFLPPVPASQHCIQGVHRQALAAIGFSMEYKSPNTSTCLNSAFVSYNHAHCHKECEFWYAINAHISTETAWQQLACYMQDILLIHSTYCTRSAIGFLFMALIAFLAAMRVLISSPSQKCACRSTSTVLDNSLAMSPSSKDESFMISVQLLPAAHASIIPAYLAISSPQAEQCMIQTLCDRLPAHALSPNMPLHWHTHMYAGEHCSHVYLS